MSEIFILRVLQFNEIDYEKIHIEYVIKRCNCRDFYIPDERSNIKYKCCCTYMQEMHNYTHPFFSEHNIDDVDEKRNLGITLTKIHFHKYFEYGNIKLNGKIFDFTKDQIEAAIIAEKLLEK